MMTSTSRRLIRLGSARGLTRGKGGEFLELNPVHRFEMPLE